jgi:excisionase family DNA binding protein
MDIKIEHAAALTGLSKKTLYKLVAAGKIPFYKADNGKNILFEREKLVEWMRERRKTSKDIKS